MVSEFGGFFCPTLVLRGVVKGCSASCVWLVRSCVTQFLVGRVRPGLGVWFDLLPPLLEFPRRLLCLGQLKSAVGSVYLYPFP